MVLLSDLDDTAQQTIGALIERKRLMAEKDHLVFSSGDFKKYIYNAIPEDTRQAYHRFWATAADKYLSDDENLAEILAHHWGLSDDAASGYETNLNAARDFFKAGELVKARGFAEDLLKLARGGGGSLSKALMLFADIAKHSGDYPSARAKYIELLWQLRGAQDENLKAETLKDLGDLYRSQKRPAKALFYTRRAKTYFEKAGNSQGVADCYNNIGLTFWIGQQYEKALESFFAALELNKQLNNFLEQAKIDSNIGIIKDIMGRTSEVAACFEEAYLNARKSSDAWLESLIANNLGYFYIRQYDLAKASHYLHEALKISEKIGYKESVINCLSNLGLCNLKAGDLFASIEYNQKAQQMAEEIGNRHLALDAELYLAEVCILMGNYALADKVIRAMESSPVHDENKIFGCQVDLLRARLWLGLDRRRNGLPIVSGARDYATSVGDSRLRLEAALISATALCDRPESVEGLISIATEAADLGHHDITDMAELTLARARTTEGHHSAAESLLAKIFSRPGQTSRILMEASACLGALRARQARFDDAISILTENELLAAGAGFLPLALEMAIELSEVYTYCGKPQKAAESTGRADAYLQQLISSLPEQIRRQDYLASPLASRLVKLKAGPADREYVALRGDRP
jgi:tetratricopeptide (TPR) repeat protein